MGIFSKKKENLSCGCDSICKGEEIGEKKSALNNSVSELGIKVLGSGCKKCNELEDAVKEALLQLNMDIKIEHVTDFSKIAEYGVMSTPALVIDDNVVSTGKVLKVKEVLSILNSNKKE